MRILFLFGHKLTIGGHFRTAQAWIRELVRMGHDVRVATWNGPEESVRPFRDAGAHWEPLERFGARQAESPLAPRQLAAAVRLAGYLRREGVDVLHMQDAVWLSAGALAAALAGRPAVLVHAGGDYINQHPPSGCELVVLSRELEEGYRADGIKAACIPARLDRTLYGPGARDPAIESQYGFPGSGFCYFMAMRIGPFKKKWLDGILSMVREVPVGRETHVVMAGGGRLFEWMKDEVAALNRRRGNYARIALLGPVYDPRHMAALYRSADVVMGHARGIMEAMCCGRPVVCLGENGEADFVTPDNVERMAYYNFSGRHFRLERNPPMLRELWSDARPRDLNALGEFSLRYADRELSAGPGARALLGVYERARPLRLHAWPSWALRRKLYYMRHAPPPGEAQRLAASI